MGLVFISTKKLREKPDWSVIPLMERVRDFLARHDYAKALKYAKKAYKLSLRKEDRLFLLENMRYWAQVLEDYVTIQDCLEDLCDLDLTVNNVQELINIYIKTNNAEKKKKFADKIKELPQEDNDGKLKVISLLAQCESHDEVIKRCEEWLEENPSDLDISKKLINAYLSKERVKDAFNIAEKLKDNDLEDKIPFELYRIYDGLLDYESALAWYLKMLSGMDIHSLDYRTSVYNMMTFASYNGVLNDEDYIKYAHIARESTKSSAENVNIKTNTNFFRKIKVGFVSYDFRKHSVGKFVMSLFDQMKGNTPLETFCYYTMPDYEDDFTAVIKSRADHFEYVGRFSDKQLREKLLKDELDVLIDLNGQTVGSKLSLLAARFAPIQVTWMGFPFSSFTNNIDYIIGDYYSDPEDGETERFCTEKVLRMDPCYMCFALQFNAQTREDPPMLKNGYVTFGNMSNVHKYSAETLTLWKKVLDRVPNSRLHLQLTKRPTEEDNNFFNENLKKRLEKFGLDLNRVDIGDWYGNEGYWRTYSEKVDIMLDTFPFCGVTTGAEAIYAGIPLLTYKHRMRHGRMSYDFQANVGITDLAASSDEEYAEIAYRLSKDVERLRDLRKNGRQRALESPLFDTLTFRTAFEEAIIGVFFDYCVKNKKRFLPYIYDDAPGKLLADCIRVTDILELRAPKDNVEQMTAYIEEYLSMLKLLTEELMRIYEGDANALLLIKKIPALMIAIADSPTINAAVHTSKLLKALLMKFV